MNQSDSLTCHPLISHFSTVITGLFRPIGLLLAGLILVWAGVSSPAHASDHQDTTFLGFDLPAADLTDLYVFESPDDPDRVVLAMDFDPLIPRGGSRPFDPAILYQFKIDNTGDTIEDLVIQFQFNGTDPDQSVSVFGPGTPNQTGVSSTLISLAGTGPVNEVFTLPGDIQVFAGLRKDPFFFDLARFFEIIPDRNYLNQPNPDPPFQVLSFNPPGVATDLLADFNVNSFVIELPRSALGGSQIGVWMTTSI
ncbi:MAG: DUF4331 family protein [Cyanobacteriota bacterium]|nr:DUF4331 family protein [Cyanobacteriota bacterium]